MDHESYNFLTLTARSTEDSHVPISISELSHLVTKTSFDEFCTVALEMLYEKLPFGLWMVTRADGEDWIVLKSLNHDYDVQDGDIFSWMDSFCCKMVKGLGPTFAPRSNEINAYANAPIGKAIPIQSYMGLPLEQSSGELLGTLCAISPQEVSQSWAEFEPFVLEVKRLIEASYAREYQAILQKRKIEKVSNQLELDDTLMVRTEQDWIKLVMSQENAASQTRSNVSVLHLIIENIDGLERNAQCVALTFKLIFGDDGIIVRRSSNSFSAIINECSAPELDAYVASIKNCLRIPKVQYNLGYATRFPNYGLDHAAEQASNRLRALGLRKAA